MTECTKLHEEIKLMKLDTKITTKSDTQEATLRALNVTLTQENVSLKKTLQSRFDQQKYEFEQEVEEEKRKTTVLEAQKVQFETRIVQLEERIQVQQETVIEQLEEQKTADDLESSKR